MQNTQRVKRIVYGLDWKPIEGKMYPAFVAATPGGFVELVDGELTGYGNNGAPLFALRSAELKQLESELLEKTGEHPKIDRRVVEFLGGPVLWESEDVGT